MADDRVEMSESGEKKSQTGNKFANDGSFLEMFKKKMEEQKALSESKSQSGQNTDESSDTSTSVDSDKTRNVEKMEKTNILPLVGKRRGGSAAKMLKTGMVKKPKQDEDEKSNENKDGWSKYMAEVNKYKSQICTDEDKTRPLVK